MEAPISTHVCHVVITETGPASNATATALARAGSAVVSSRVECRGRTGWSWIAQAILLAFPINVASSQVPGQARARESSNRASPRARAASEKTDTRQHRNRG
jgi:hypothetical protein